MIDILHERGLCISYDRVLQISSDIANSVITQFEKSGVVCPSFFKNNVFTTGNLDNIDYNPSSITSKDSFHGTAISLMQHYTVIETMSPVIFNMNTDVVDTKKTKHLPESYTDVQPVSLKDKLPSPRGLILKAQDQSGYTISEQEDWLKHVLNIVNSGVLDKDDFISWSGYFTARKAIEPRIPAMSALLPQFRDEAHSVAMIRHGMHIIREAIQLSKILDKLPYSLLINLCTLLRRKYNGLGLQGSGN